MCATDFLWNFCLPGYPDQVEKALSLIGKKFKELCLTNIYGLPPPTPLTLHSLLMTAWVSPSLLALLILGGKAVAGHCCHGVLDLCGCFTNALKTSLILCGYLSSSLCDCCRSDLSTYSFTTVSILPELRNVES